ncbi:Fis family transcriptional regulator [Amylibacter kogurei]|uniref:Fis family transcriptional regulator n=1 Tax=Paramylibacter kogurei TaxID=1889778 RepID=A0A2G5K5S1_9RHOB|nr:sigma-54 dependent transcriptional regulator [Amylibacter kogurei]PIB24881.1 Fis family transcriptional regulator [Amylibacter kogurei]
MPEQITITIVDDEQDMRESISQWLTLSGYRTKTFASAEDALKVIDSDYSGIIISDIKMPKIDGITFLKKLQSIDSQLPVILITGHGDVAMAVEAMRIGAYDFLEKPFDPERMAELTKRAVHTRRLTLENRTLRRELSDGTVLLRKLIGTSPVMERLREDILDLAQADGHLLIKGETGTGKSLIAHALHACGPRQGKKFISVNCAAYTEDDLSTRLFGPLDDSTPLVENALGGTLCLEDIESLPASIQARLLSEITEHDRGEDGSALRIIAISNDTSDNDENLESALRQDLYYRLAAMHITPPPLRQRGEDILSLFNRYAETFSEEYGCEQPEISAEDAAKLLQAPWPGNIRQLINLAERTVLQSRRGSYSISNILMADVGEEVPDVVTDGKPLKEHVEAFERMLIDNTMRRHKGSIQSVMEELSLPRRTLNEKMAKYGLTRSNYVG